MIRVTLIILLGLSIFVSFSAQAGNRHGHYNKHHGGHNHKHQRHHNRHHGHHKYSHGARGYRYRHDSYYGYGRYPRAYAVPNVPRGTRYGYSASGALIVYQRHPYRDHRY